jgi:cytidyltransferase-like protein
MNKVLVTGSFDNVQARHVRFLEEAAKLGSLHVLLWDDPAAKFPLAERRYFLEALRFVTQVTDVALNPLMTDQWFSENGLWVWPEEESSPHRQDYCARRGISYRVITNEQIAGFPNDAPISAENKARKKVIVTGCFDFFHSGHVRFFEEASEYGDLYVVVGSDANVRLLKGEGHPLFSQDERRYLVGAVRYVTGALVSTGSGWMDAAPEIERLRPQIYLVNEDGDKPDKRQFCAENGLEYVVLKRTPAPGLPRRSSTDLRGF